MANFFGGLGRGLLKGLSFLGGGNPLSGALGVGGAIASGVAQGGKQSSQNTTQTGTTATTGNVAQTQSGTTQQQDTELPELSAFRRPTMQAFQQELNDARTTPVFGEAQQADFVNRVNETTNQAFENINQRLAARGAGASGQLRSDSTELELGRGRALTDFFSQLPFREAQARNQRVDSLLSAGLNFAGRGPGGMTGSTSATGNTASTQNVESNQQTDTETGGPGILGGILGQLGQLAAGGAARRGERPEPFDESMIDRPSDVEPGNAPLPTDVTIPQIPPFQIFPQSGALQTNQYFQRR